MQKHGPQPKNSGPLKIGQHQLPRPIPLNNGNSSLVGFVVRNRKTGEVIDDGFGHVKVYENGKAAKRKASALNNAPAYRIDHWVVFPCNIIVGQREVR